MVNTVYPVTTWNISRDVDEQLVTKSLGVQVISHSFGRRRPPVLRTSNMVEDKIRMCDVLSDIEVAQDMLDPKQEEDQQLQPHPADEKYATLMADLKIISPDEEEYKIIDKYCKVRLSCNS